MTEQELRAIVRAAIARHAGTSGPTGLPSTPPAVSPSATSWRTHSSHGLYLSLVNPSDSCLIEPAVPCTHCNYCNSHGH